MKFRYYRETDSLYIDLADRPSADSREVAPGVVIDLDEDGNLTGIDIDNASRVADLTRLESDAVPLSYAREQGAAYRVREPGSGGRPAYHVLRDDTGEYHWRLTTAGEVIATSSVGYPTLEECLEAIRVVQRVAAGSVEGVPS